MRVFISWSGERSRAAALALRTWLPKVLQSVEPYVSSEDIDKGARWSSDIARRLDETSFGIVCVTRDNVAAPWVNFEAGALAKSFDASRVTPLLLDLAPSDVTGPLAQFQAAVPTLEDVTRLMQTLNSATEAPIDDAQVVETVALWWPRLEEALAAIPETEQEHAARPQSAILAELLELTRSIQRRVALLELRQTLAPTTAQVTFHPRLTAADVAGGEIAEQIFDAVVQEGIAGVYAIDVRERVVTFDLGSTTTKHERERLHELATRFGRDEVVFRSFRPAATPT